MNHPLRFLASAVIVTSAACAQETGGLAPAEGPDAGELAADEDADGARPVSESTSPAVVDATVSSSAGDAGAEPGGGGTLCNLGTAESTASADNLDLFGEVVFFGMGRSLPAGTYRAVYEDGCMKYNFLQGWTIHNSDTSGWWIVGEDSSNHIARPPGTVGVFPAAGAYADFNACVAANKALPPSTFEHGGGKLGIYLEDAPYLDNVAGTVNPRWRLERLGACPVLR